MSNLQPDFFVDHLSGRMSLREPQRVSLEILDKILSVMPLEKEQDLEKALAAVKDLFPICSDFERDFMSLTFALATGVGKTRLMGAFIAYLYMRHNVHNFFVVAPNTTIYDKLKRDLGDVTNPKYVFNGIDCFAVEKPAIIDGDNYNAVNMFGDKVKIYVFNIDKFNSDDGRMRRLNEVIGDSFYDYLTKLNDLVVIMDESHHYRAKQGAKAINGLKPVLGLELTATPVVMNGSRETKFKNVVYEYPLSRAIADGFTRTPYALARGNLNLSKVGDEERDKLMLNDGIDNHERIRAELSVYAQNNDKRVVKPFVLIVCKDTQHAEWVKSIICSKDFRDGYYINRTIMVHSNQRGGESDANKALLLSVERADNPVEIVIHVNMLKEGWDVNNLYTIIPLRTASSAVLREQMVGRGLRLPYGKRTGNDRVDSVVLTAHDKFQEILDEAQKGNS
ncbi:MAG: DEAD/DEAH box helicase family protein, partial [Phascolarctobacterium sp.]|nr:DEAD/DEAH box helicase family protein [Candidatus Phascolarctobacterium caballi]